MEMFELLKKIYPLRLAPVSEDSDRAVEILKDEFDFKVYEFDSSSEHNGWIVPQSWKVKKALILRDNKVIYDGAKHPLGVMGYAKSFQGKVSLAELKKHLTYRKDCPDAIGYHCDYYYKSWASDWGISVPYSLFHGLAEGEYEVDLKTEFSAGTMKVLDCFIPGESKDIIFFNAHNCHAAQANDDISGVVVGVELMKRLAMKKRKYSYRLIIAPEHLGTVFYLANLSEKEVKNFKFGVFLEMLGTDNCFALQKSFLGNTLIDEAFLHHLSMNYLDIHIDDFRKIIGNDETVWEAAGYEIPCVSLSRGLFPQYHTSLDNEDIISKDRLEESVRAVLGTVDILETNATIKRHFKGLVALSNPKYDLYKPMMDPSMRPVISDEERSWNYLMDCLPRYFDEKMTILDIAIKHHIEYSKLYAYINKFKEKGLISFVA